MKTRETSPSPCSAQLDTDGRAVLDTNEAAWYLTFQPQTLRRWACYDNGPIQPVRIGGRLRWRVADLKKLVGGR